jgi:flagellar biosynthesis regulator FlaF
MTTRDEFTPATKRSLAIRAAHFCSNPFCLKLTAGPHSDPTKHLTTGHAAHIHAAAPKGPRYDPDQLPNQRQAISNGLWLCRECGDIVDKDTSPHSPAQLRKWKENHEEMIKEVRTKGYSKSLELLQNGAKEPQIARKIIYALEGRRALWTTFDAEFPDRVRTSLDSLRSEITMLRGEAGHGTAMSTLLSTLGKTILSFFSHLEHIDLTKLRCDAGNPEWVEFSDALLALRKSIGLQIFNVINTHDITPGDELKSILPKQA